MAPTAVRAAPSARKLLVPGIVLAALVSTPPALARDKPTATRDLAWRAEFQHGGPTGNGYTTTFTGVLDLLFSRNPASGTARAAFPLQGGSCFTLAWWQPGGGTQPAGTHGPRAERPGTHTAPRTTRPAELCLAAPATEESAFNAWMAGKRVADPRLVVPLTPLGTAGDAWTNPSALAARAFLRGCGNTAYRTLGGLRIEAGGLVLGLRQGNLGRSESDLSATQAILEITGLAVWPDVLAGCDGSMLGLPGTPSAGTSVTFTGTTERQPPDPALPQPHIAALVAAVADLASGPVLSRGQGKSLRRPLAKSLHRLLEGSADRARRELEKFERKVTQLEAQGTLSSSDAGGLRAESGVARDAISALVMALPVPPPDPDRYCAPAPEVCPENLCAYTTYHVDARDAARRGCGLAPPGSAVCAFATIGEALEQAEAEGRCGASLVVGAGSYVGDIALARNLRIRGSAGARPTLRGTISSRGPHELALAALNLAPAAGRGVDVDHPCADVSLDDVVVAGTRGYGILQRGGALHVRASAVNLTASEPDALTRGTGVFLTCGAQAVLDDLSLVRNASAALQVVGSRTEVSATRLLVTETGVHPAIAADPCAAPALFGAVQVRDGARLTVSVFTVSGSWMYGLLVAGAAARATLRDGAVVGTAALGGECGQLGHNMVALHDGALDATDFLSSEADVAGILVAAGGVADLRGSGAGGRGDCRLVVIDGEEIEVCDIIPTALVNRNAIGASVATEGFDVERLRDRVLYRDNERTLDTTEVPVPGPAPGDGD